MAKKRGVTSPLGNTAGAAEAAVNAAKANIESLSRQLSSELEKSGEDATAFLKSHFGLESVSGSVEWKLASGNTATFNEVTLTFEQVKNDTTVTFDVNGRDQSQLTEESLADLNSLAFQQFYPAVGRETGGKIDVLDGSRRRAWFLLQEGKVAGFRILVTRDDISVADAKALARQLQTAKEHNLREIGLQCMAIRQANKKLTQAEVAELTGLSQSGVSKALKAASIDEKLIALFPVVNALSHPDYTLLSKVMRVCCDGKTLNTFVSNIDSQLVNIQAEYSIPDQKDAIISAVKAELKLAEEKQSTDKAEVTPLAEFDTKGVFARKRIKGRNFSYEFGRLPASVQEELDQAVARILGEYKEQ